MPNKIMEIPNYLLDMVDKENDISVRIGGFENYFRKIWQETENKNKTLIKLKITKRSFHQYLKGSRSFPISVVYKICKEYSEQKETNFQQIWDEIFKQTKTFKTICNKSRKVALPKKLTNDLTYLVGSLRDGV